MGYKCICPPGFGGMHCSISIDPCAGFTCFHGGSCKFKDGDKRPQCSCKDGFQGDYCERRSDPCAGVKCKHSGTCKPSPMGNGFLCHCAKGYHGEVCELEMNPCDSSPCKNGGTCKNYISTFHCICPENISGKYCEKTKHENKHTSSTQNDGASDHTAVDPDKSDESKNSVSGSDHIHLATLQSYFFLAIMFVFTTNIIRSLLFG